MGALSRLDEFHLNPQVRTYSGTVPGTSRSNNSENRKPTGDKFLNDPYPEVDFSVRQASTSADSDREETSHIGLNVASKHRGLPWEEISSHILHLSSRQSLSNCRSIPAKPTGIKKEKDTPDCLKNRRNCINTLDFSISIQMIKLQ